MMSLVEWLAQPAGRVLSLALLHFVWQGLLIALLLAAVVELARIRRAATRYACSLVALLAMMVCPVGTLTWLSFDAGSAAIIAPMACVLASLPKNGTASPVRS